MNIEPSCAVRCCGPRAERAEAAAAGPGGELAARSGLAVFLAKVLEHDAERSGSDQLNPLKPAPFEVKELLTNGLEVEENGYTVSIHFVDTKDGYSTDNSTDGQLLHLWGRGVQGVRQCRILRRITRRRLSTRNGSTTDSRQDTNEVR